MKASSNQEDWEVLLEELPRGWKKYAVECGAVQRLRGIRTLETVLRVLMVHVGGGVSLRTAVTMARSAGWGEVSAVALWKRLRAAERWFHGIIQAWTSGRAGACGDEPVHLVDGTCVTEPGPTGSVWRIHYRFTLPTFECTAVELTDAHVGEGFKNFSVAPGEWLVADSAYARPPHIAYAVRHGARVIVRVPWKTLPLYDERGEVLPLLARARRLAPLGSTEQAARIRVKGSAQDTWVAGRVCIMKKSAQASKASRKRIIRETRRKTGRMPQPDTVEAAGYVMLWTNDTAQPREKIFARYRCRWQIELSFKRMKSLMRISALPKYDPHSARAWLYGKLLLALWIERLIARGARFSPWTSLAPETLLRTCGASQRVARMGVYGESGPHEYSPAFPAEAGVADLATHR